MNIKKEFTLFYALILCVKAFAVQLDTLKIARCTQLPKVDGVATDSTWLSANWIEIDQSWIPLKKNYTDSDFKGRFKVMWSNTSQLLYFIAEITDDIFRDGYVYNKRDVTYGDYDIFEVFIDADHSGGLHVFDGKCADNNNMKCWGTNAENAFTYHINVNAPTEGETTNIKTVEDISGKNWSSKYIRNYADHLPHFAFKKQSSNTYVYEFSLRVFKDSYNPKKPFEAEIDSLFLGKIFGLSVAYSDCDIKTGKPKRESFIGSTKMEKTALDNHGYFNSTWMDATFLGVVQLISN